MYLSISAQTSIVPSVSTPTDMINETARVMGSQINITIITASGHVIHGKLCKSPPSPPSNQSYISTNLKSLFIAQFDTKSKGDEPIELLPPSIIKKKMKVIIRI